MNRIKKRFFPSLRQKALRTNRKKKIVIFLDKRKKFVLGVFLISLLLFITEFQFGKGGILTVAGISLFTDIFLFWTLKDDLKENFSYQVLLLPVLYVLAFGLFYFLIPGRILFRFSLTGFFALGLYSLFLCQNIFIVGSIRTIQLLSGARIVSFVLTLISYFFLSNIIFTLHVPIYITAPIIFLYTFLLMTHSLWTYTLQKGEIDTKIWRTVLSICIVEVAVMLWFWPSSPTVIALFLTGFFYAVTGLSHVWLERRLFRSVLWEYVWVCAVVFFVLVLFSGWGK